MKPQKININVADDGSTVSIRVGTGQIVMSASDADVLLRSMIVVCDEAKQRQQEAGIVPMTATLGEKTPRAIDYRTLVGKGGVLLELISGIEPTVPNGIAAFELEPDLAEGLGSALSRSAQAARQRHRPL